MIFVLLWSILPFLIGWGAKEKGLCPVSFFVLSFFLSPIVGFIVLIIRQPDKRMQEYYMLKKGVYMKCDLCREVVKRDATVCKHCHSNLNECEWSEPNIADYI